MNDFMTAGTPAAVAQMQAGGQPQQMPGGMAMAGGGFPEGLEMPEFIPAEQAFQENEVLRSVLFSRLAQLRPEMAAKLDAAVTMDNLDVFLALLPELAPVLSEASALEGLEQQQAMGAAGGMPPQPMQQPMQQPMAQPGGMPPQMPSGLARQRFGG